MSKNINILFVAGFGPIIHDQEASQRLYLDTLGLPLKADGDYFHTEELKGVNHFALWPLSQAAQSCFGSSEWPKDLPTPQAWMEFDVENIEEATAELKARGYKLLVGARKEPWGQVVTRFLGPEGILLGVTFTPWMREERKKS